VNPAYVAGARWTFAFEMKFYPTEPATLHEDLTRYNVFSDGSNRQCPGAMPPLADYWAPLAPYPITAFISHHRLWHLVASRYWGMGKEGKGRPPQEPWLRLAPNSGTLEPPPLSVFVAASYKQRIRVVLINAQL